MAANENLNKKDLEIILEINRKAIEIETEVAEQNEEIIKLLNSNESNQKKIDEKLDKLVKQGEEMNKDLFKIQILFITGMLTLVAQILQIFLKK